MAKILHLLNSSFYSGAENMAIQVIKMFNDTGYEAVYCSLDGPIRQALEKENIKFIPVGSLNIHEVRSVIKEYEPNIIHAHDMKASVIAAMSTLKTPIVAHIHGNSQDARRITLKSLGFLFASIKIRWIFWVSNSAMIQFKFRKLVCNKSQVLINIVDTNTISLKSKLDSKEYNYDIVYLGRLSYEKNPERLISILEKVVDRYAGVRIAIIGTGELLSKIQILAEAKKINKNIDFLGFVKNPFKILKSSKVMIMSSRWEGTPMAALEAQSLGLTIVTTPTDGLCDIITNGFNGFISNDDETLAAQLFQIIVNPDLRKEISNNALARSKKTQNKQTYYNEIQNIYDSIL